MTEVQLNAALNLMRRMPPAQTENNLTGLINLLPDLTDDLLQRIDQPLKVSKDTKTGKHYVLCDYNRDGDSYRSPWSNQYFPEMDDGFTPSSKLRSLEIEANQIFDVYRQLYYEGGYSSAYFWDIDDTNFASCWLIQKDVEGVRGLNKGFWNSIHVIEANQKSGGKFEYKLTTTVIVSMRVQNAQLGVVDLSGSMSKQSSSIIALDDEHTHIANMGRMLEDAELAIRNSLESIYIQKTREIISGVRNPNGQLSAAMRDNFTQSLKEAVGAHKSTRTIDSDS